MASPAKRRIMRDFKRIQEDPPEGISGSPSSVSKFSAIYRVSVKKTEIFGILETVKSEDNLMEWNAVIFGPTDTPFEDGTFKLTIKFSG